MVYVEEKIMINNVSLFVNKVVTLEEKSHKFNPNSPQKILDLPERPKDNKSRIKITLSSEGVFLFIFTSDWTLPNGKLLVEDDGSTTATFAISTNFSKIASLLLRTKRKTLSPAIKINPLWDRTDKNKKKILRWQTLKS